MRDVQDAEYNDQIDLPAITEKEVEDTIRAASPHKAPGPDGIPNRALQVAAPLITAHLTRIYNQSLRLEYSPAHFRESTTVVLRKSAMADYRTPKAYRPIALLNTMGKIMEAVIARRLSYLVEAHQMLPARHIGGRKMRSTEHALHIIIGKIHEAWNRKKGQVASLLLLDVCGAYDNVSHSRLLACLEPAHVVTSEWLHVQEIALDLRDAA